MSTTESGTYYLTAIAGGLFLGLVIGVPLAWVIGTIAERYMPKRSQQFRVVVGTLFLLAGAWLWYRGAFNFMIDAIIVGIGVGFLVDAARRARHARAPPPLARA